MRRLQEKEQRYDTIHSSNIQLLSLRILKYILSLFVVLELIYIQERVEVLKPSMDDVLLDPRVC